MKTIAKLRTFNTVYGSQSYNDDVRRKLFVQELDLDIFPNGPEKKHFVAQKANFGDPSVTTEFYFQADCAEELLDQLALTWATVGKVSRYGEETPLWALFIDGDLFSLQTLEGKVRTDLSGMDEAQRLFLAQRINAHSYEVEHLEVCLIDHIVEAGYAPY